MLQVGQCRAGEIAFKCSELRVKYSFVGVLGPEALEYAFSMNETIWSQRHYQPEQAIDVKSTGLVEGSDQQTYASGSSEGRLTARIAHRP